MRQLTYRSPGNVEWEEAPEPPAPGPDDALVHPLAVARCDLDPLMATLGLFPGPFPVGHETVAEVASVGSAVSGLRPGDHVLVPFQLSCGTCDACATERFGGCRTYKAKAGGAFGFGPAGGGHGGAVADLLSVPAAEHLLLPAPADLPARVLATLPDNVVDAYRAVGPQLAAAPGADVLVLGGLAASIGLYAVGWALALGAGSVRYADDDAERLAAAEAMGADAVAQDLSEGWPHHLDRAPITVDNTGDADGLATTIRSTDVYGWCTSVVIHFQPTTPVPLLEMYTRGITLHVSRADSRRFLPTVVEHVAAGRFDPGVVPTTVVPWDQADRTWLAPATKLVVER